MKTLDNLFGVQEVNYADRIGAIDKESAGVVKCQKNFPIFAGHDGKQKIFKPLSPTKPYANPMFAYSEVWWSHLINNFIDERAPRYQLARCHGMPPKAGQEIFLEKGTLVDSYLEPGQHDMNLLEYYRANPDPEVDIDQYTNYCDHIYDYRDIFNSELFSRQPELSSRLAEMVLTSIMTININFHYENVTFICENDKVVDLAPPIDHEFSLLSINPHNSQRRHEQKLANYESLLTGTWVDKELQTTHIDPIGRDAPLYATDHSNFDAMQSNLQIICDKHPNTVRNFIEKMQKMREFLITHHIVFQSMSNFIEPFHDLESYVYYYRKPSHNNEEMAKLYESYVKVGSRKKINLEKFGADAIKHTLLYSRLLEEQIEQYLEQPAVQSFAAI